MNTAMFKLIFDDTMIKQLKKAAKNNQVKQILTKTIDKIRKKASEA